MLFLGTRFVKVLLIVKVTGQMSICSRPLAILSKAQLHTKASGSELFFKLLEIC